MPPGRQSLAYRRYSLDYVETEADARAARRGIWAGEFVKPWEWRRGKRLESAESEACTACDLRHKRFLKRPEKCAIKGNISRSGERIFHIPGGQYYDRTKISPAKGQRWFCSEAEATAAGWRKSKR